VTPVRLAILFGVKAVVLVAIVLGVLLYKGLI
jgi:hypothetical protein